MNIQILEAVGDDFSVLKEGGLWNRFGEALYQACGNDALTLQHMFEMRLRSVFKPHVPVDQKRAFMEAISSHYGDRGGQWSVTYKMDWTFPDGSTFAHGWDVYRKRGEPRALSRSTYYLNPYDEQMTAQLDEVQGVKSAHVNLQEDIVPLLLKSWSTLFRERWNVVLRCLYPEESAAPEIQRMSTQYERIRTQFCADTPVEVSELPSKYYKHFPFSTEKKKTKEAVGL